MNKQRILEVLEKSPGRSFRFDELCAALKIRKSQRKSLRETVEALVSRGKIHEDSRGLLRVAGANGTFLGTVRRTSSGAAYITPRTQIGVDEVYVFPEDLGDAQTGDVVRFRLQRRRRSGGQRLGTVDEIIERTRTTFVGTYFEEHGKSFVRVDGRTFEEAIPVGDPGSRNAAENDKVVIEMLRFPKPTDLGEAVLVKVLGAKGEVGVDTESIIHEFGLATEFPDEVLAEARLEAERFVEHVPDDREDLTGETIVTIDPVDARDFDDAISLKRTNDGHWHLGVHIADVSHFVREKSHLDREAKRRGTSTYLPGMVIPMLPELISNGLASLQQGRIRFAKSVLLEYDAEGTPLFVEFANSAIKVTHRFAYEEVLPIVNAPEGFRGTVSEKVRELVCNMHEFAMLLRKKRMREGYLEMILPEVKIDIDKQGDVSGAHEVNHDESHQMIEEFMLAANMAVAEYIGELNAPFLRRIHPPPTPAKLKDFGRFASFLGYKVGRHVSREDMQRVLREARGKSEERALSFALLRSMKQAQYSSEELGHYALNCDDYCHFTSPIRRYPDLTVHRMIDRIIREDRPETHSAHHMYELGRKCSSTERIAEAAERELVKVKLLRYMETRIGEEMTATVTGVERYGIFCRGVEIPAEGLVPIEALGHLDHFQYDSDAMSLVGSRTNRRIRLGDEVRVIVAEVNIDRRELTFLAAENQPGFRNRKYKKPTGRKPQAQRKKPRAESKEKSGRKTRSTKRR